MLSGPAASLGKPAASHRPHRWCSLLGNPKLDELYDALSSAEQRCHRPCKSSRNHSITLSRPLVNTLTGAY
jgi:hypothetical protein